MKEMGLNYSWERTGKAVDKLSLGDFRFSDTGTIKNNTLETHTLGSNRSNADLDKSYESKLSSKLSKKRDFVAELDKFIEACDEKN